MELGKNKHNTPNGFSLTNGFKQREVGEENIGSGETLCWFQTSETAWRREGAGGTRRDGMQESQEGGLGAQTQGPAGSSSKTSLPTLRGLTSHTSHMGRDLPARRGDRGTMSHKLRTGSKAQIHCGS